MLTARSISPARHLLGPFSSTRSSALKSVRASRRSGRAYRSICADRVDAAGLSIASQLPADGRGGTVDQASNPAQAEALGLTELNGGAFFNAEFGIGHRGSTVPEWSGVALSFRGRLD